MKSVVVILCLGFWSESFLLAAVVPGLKQFRRLHDTGVARMHFGRAQFLAVDRAEPRGEILLQRLRPVGGNQASRVQRAAESARCPPAAKRFQVVERDGRVTGNFAPGIQHSLGAVETFRRLPENFQGVFFHAKNEPRAREKLQSQMDLPCQRGGKPRYASWCCAIRLRADGVRLGRMGLL